jgi:hypothetical protein
MLPNDLREEAAENLESALYSRLDATILTDRDFLGMMDPSRLLLVAFKIYELLLEGMPSRVEATAEEADLDREPGDNFDDLQSYLTDIELAFYSEQTILDAIATLRSQIGRAVTKIAERIALKKKEATAEWDELHVAPKVVAPSSKSRSIFSDLNE